MGKLLVWGDALFLVRYDLGKLQIQRVSVDAEEKKVSLHLCKVSGDGEAAALPVDTRLVAANEVEDLELATRYPVLVFLASQATELTAQSSPASRKRRRSNKDKEAAASDDNAVSRPGARLVLCILSEAEGDNEIRLHVLNMLENPTRAGDEVTAVVGNDSNALQVFLTDGPHMLLFERCSQLATLLKLQISRQGDGSIGFYVWREQLDVLHGMKGDTPAAFEVVSCSYVSERHSTRPHVLIHAQRLPSSSSDDSESHTWSVVDLDYDRGNYTNREISSQCQYLPLFPSVTGCNGVMSILEQVTCCCFISELSEWDFTAASSSETAVFTSWDQGSKTRPIQMDIGVPTLLVTGTTSNTIYVHTNRILLLSYVLPTRPAEMWCMSEDNLDQRHVLCVRCDDENHSFFVLGFSSNVQNVSMELLLSFNHVGHAHIGDFAGIHATDASAVLLLNDVRGNFGTNNYSVGNEVGADKSLDDGQLVKRCVLVTQKTSTPEIKLSCHRLRLREEKKNKHGSRSRKRSRNDEKISPASLKPEPFRYIERTQKASSRRVDHLDKEKDGAADFLAASHAQLGKLAGSLSTRLSNGLQELERLQIIVSDKNSLARQLNQLIARLWQKQQTRVSPSKEHSLLMSLVSTQEVGSLSLGSQGRVDMETIVSTPSTATIIPKNGAKDGPIEQVSDSPLGDLKREQQVSLEQFSVLEYVPSSSLVHAEVVLKNLSDIVLYDSFVVLTAPKGGRTSTQGWRCSCSVVPEFSPALDMADHTTKQPGRARFQLELQFAPSFSFLRERKPLEVMLWLHWGASQDDLLSNMALAWRPSESALAVASVKIYPEDLVSVRRGSLTTARDDWSGGGSTVKEQKQLLFISSGSNLASWFGKPSVGISTFAGSVIRPMFALVNINVRSRELMLYELSTIVANLPSDVYAMHNPFQHTHLRALQRVLRSMRHEILTSQQQDSADKEKMVGDNGARAKHRKRTQKAKDRDPASTYRAMQRDTDLQMNLLLQGLQKRVNFHSMWFDTNNGSRLKADKLSLEIANKLGIHQQGTFDA